MTNKSKPQTFTDVCNCRHIRMCHTPATRERDRGNHCRVALCPCDGFETTDLKSQPLTLEAILDNEMLLRRLEEAGEEIRGLEKANEDQEFSHTHFAGNVREQYATFERTITELRAKIAALEADKRAMQFYTYRVPAGLAEEG